MHLFYTHGSAFLHILTLMHFGGLQHHLNIFNTIMFSSSKMSCTHVHHFRTFYHVSMHHTSAHLWIFNIIHTCVTCCQNLHTSADTHPFIFHHIPGTLYCISEHLPAWKHMYTEYPVLSMHSMQNIWKNLDTNLLDSAALLTHWFTSPNISIAQGHTSMLSPVSILPHQFGIFCLFSKI